MQKLLLLITLLSQILLAEPLWEPTYPVAIKRTINNRITLDEFDLEMHGDLQGNYSSEIYYLLDSKGVLHTGCEGGDIGEIVADKFKIIDPNSKGKLTVKFRAIHHWILEMGKCPALLTDWKTYYSDWVSLTPDPKGFYKIPDEPDLKIDVKDNDKDSLVSYIAANDTDFYQLDKVPKEEITLKNLESYIFEGIETELTFYEVLFSRNGKVVLRIIINMYCC